MEYYHHTVYDVPGKFLFISLNASVKLIVTSQHLKLSRFCHVLLAYVLPLLQLLCPGCVE